LVLRGVREWEEEGGEIERVGETKGIKTKQMK
jgi:hypothetical protein